MKGISAIRRANGIAFVHHFWYIDAMPDTLTPIPLVFWRSAAGREPVREWLNDFSKTDKRALGRDIAKLQYGWPIGLPLCKPLAGGLWELRVALSGNREMRIFFGFHEGMMIALHAIAKKTRKTPTADLALARQRLKETQKW